MSTEHTLGVILSGGAGARVGGADKGLLTVHGQPVVARVAAVLRPQCTRMVVVANRNQEDYASVAQVISDETSGHAGPLAGIAAALALAIESGDADYAHCQWLLTVPVDCPDFPADLGARLHDAFDADTQAACAFARDEHKVQPLFALYSLKHGKALLQTARAAVRVHGSVLRWHLELRAREVAFRDQDDAFHNLNGLHDFHEYEQTHA